LDLKYLPWVGVPFVQDPREGRRLLTFAKASGA